MKRTAGKPIKVLLLILFVQQGGLSGMTSRCNIPHSSKSCNCCDILCGEVLCQYIYRRAGMETERDRRKDEGKGIRLMNVRAVVDKYGGDFAIFCDSEKLQAVVML